MSIELSPDLLPPGSRVLCAVSGGADSVCLLHLLSRREDLSLVAAHFNHQLRGEESDRDEQFVRQLCEGWSIPLTVGRGDVNAFARREKLSLEEAGRVLRYAFLEKAAQTEGCDRIATAHNADDNAESLLMNLIRGAGLRGLGGIPPSRGPIVRPLLPFSRSHILAYLDRHAIPHREDSSNTDETYTRNRLRAQVMPLLRALNPQAVEHINAAAAQLAQADQFLDQEARRYLGQPALSEGCVSLPWERLRQAPRPLQPRLVFLLLDRLGAGRKDLGSPHLEAVLSLPPGGSLDLPHGLAARRERDLLILELRPQAPVSALLRPNVPLSWGGYTLTLLDRRQGEGLALNAPETASIQVGPCPPAQRLFLPGSKGARTVKRLCLDLGIPLSQRESLPAFYVDGRLAAVWGLGVDEHFFSPADPDCRFIQIQQTEEREQHGKERDA